MTRKTTFQILGGLLLLAFLSPFLFLSSEKSIEKISQNDLQELYPNEWMYLQRAYPDNVINAEAIRNAKLQHKSIMAARSESGGTWAFNGPLNTGGRVTDVAISPIDDDVLYVAAATGGVFRTTDGGSNWTPVFDVVGEPSIGDIAIAPNNPERLYVGTGEANGSAGSGAFFGSGMYRSDDSGINWESIGLEESNHIGRIVVDPNDADRLFVAAAGKLYGYNSERGVYRSTNGGDDWEKVLFVTDSTAAIDISMNTANTDILFAAMWERTRKPWQRDYGGVTSGIHRTTNGGDTWELLGTSNGLPAPSTQTGRIGLEVSQSNPNIVYARYTANEITNSFDAIYKSIDGGDNWTEINSGPISNVDASFGWYFGNLRIDPIDPDEVVVLGQRIFRTTNSGSNWTEINGMHVDHHALEYSKLNPNFMLAGNDGGAYISNNGGNTWTQFQNLPITQFYNIEVDNTLPERLYGGTQDNNTIRTTTGNLDDYVSIWGGDGFHVNVDPVDNNFIYVEAQFGSLGRSTNGGASFQSATNGISAGDRNNWNTPVVLSPFNPETVYYGTNRLYSSTRAVSWSPISPDLTDGQHPSGSFSYGTLTAIGPSHLNLNTIYTGSDDGNVHVTFDGGTTWENISGGLPDRYVTSIAVAPSSDQVAYVTLSGFTTLDYTPHVFKTEDGGQNWTDISGNLPSIPVNDIVMRTDESMLFVSTDLNVWYSDNYGASWSILGDNLPLTLTRDLKIHEDTNTLFAGTYGRSIHSFDLNNIVLGVDESLAVSENIALYPVPTSEEINLSHKLVGHGTISLYNIRGAKVKDLYVGDLDALNAKQFSVSDQSAGIYFITIKTNGQSISKKIIKQ